ncbi:Non-motile and phage-resistance protein [Salinivirga cyanobacteriivorans]|uniref:histidine kinase n=1 Tax=Salinivirga cyanobacteriivorans TaxID=1307839 RepID=A0A0S2HXS8_9BACT|nr:HAMP domain-containing sensor histidine kinase [Salinivirga cyanobacteriivorans]ALO14788.1 Non-motile and phage-resistance protein [Salinivirga cyanobacteriivorans]
MEEMFSNSEKERLTELIKKVQDKNDELEKHRKKIELQNEKSRQRTIELFGKMIDLKKAKKIISIQNEELEKKNEEINRKRAALENTYVKFRKRTIELFGKMVDLRKAYNIINNQKKEIENQRKQLHELNISKDKFFSIIAHDLKNPIAGFLGLTEVMAQDMNSFTDQEKQEFIELIYKSSKQLHSLLENLLQWSRAQTGRLSYKPRRLNMHALFQENFSLIHANAEVKQIVVEEKVDNDLEVWADVDMVNTILRNLLTNAIKFSNNDSRITVYAEIEGDKVIISVKDEGIGISDEDLDKLFKIGYNKSKVGTANEEGTGLGLILCKEFAKRNGGDVMVDSKLGVGSIFSFSLPRAQQGGEENE